METGNRLKAKNSPTVPDSAAKIEALFTNPEMPKSWPRFAIFARAIQSAAVANPQSAIRNPQSDRVRNFLIISYLGTNFYGWQRQPGQISVQETLENALSVVLRQPIEIVGCGRTDTGVHARFYVAHADFEGENLVEKLLFSLNAVLPGDVAVHQISPVSAAAHARFDAFERSYEYHVSLKKDPFCQQTAWIYPLARRANLEKMNTAARLLLDFSEFAPFAKTDSDRVGTTTCQISRAEWILTDDDRLVFHISANRFLRGMVRLVVGMCLNVGFGKTSIDEVRAALDAQKPLRLSLSVPPQGLFLTDVKYPFAF